MKEIKAYIRRERLDRVIRSLATLEGLSGVSVNSITGFGRSRGVLRMINFETHFKLEAVCGDNLKDDVVNMILKTGRTDQRGDGKVFVSTVEEAYRIETTDRLGEG